MPGAANDRDAFGALLERLANRTTHRRFAQRFQIVLVPAARPGDGPGKSLEFVEVDELDVGLGAIVFDRLGAICRLVFRRRPFLVRRNLANRKAQFRRRVEKRRKDGARRRRLFNRAIFPAFGAILPRDARERPKRILANGLRNLE